MENTDKIQDKVVSMLDALQQGAATVGDKVVKYTPDVVDAGLWVIRIEGINEIISALFALIICIVFYKLFTRLMPWAKTKERETEGIAYIIPLGTLAISATLGIKSAIELIYVWNWIAIFEPKLYLAKQIIESVTK